MNQAIILSGTSGFSVFNHTGVNVNFAVSDAGLTQLGEAGVVVGALEVFNATSGNITISPPTGALGTVAQSWPSVSGAIASCGLGLSQFTNSLTTNPLGYATGAGGTVAQATSKATGVTLSKASGQITMNAAALAAATIASFVLTNTSIAATDVLVLNHISGGTVGSYTLNAQCAAGSATINVRNNTAGSLSEAIVIQFALVKAVNA